MVLPADEGPEIPSRIMMGLRSVIMIELVICALGLGSLVIDKVL